MTGSSYAVTFVVSREGEGFLPRGPERMRFTEGGVRQEEAPGENGRGWSWDGSRVLVRNDRFGFYPLFYCSSPDTFAISNHLAALLPHAASPELDDAALAVFLRLGFFLGNHTPFRHIRALPPACTLTWEDGRLTVDAREEPMARSEAPPSRNQALREMGEVFQASLERMLPEPGERVGLPLSGGRDSRHILLALNAAGRLPDACLTMRHFPPKSNEDARIAALVCERFGVRHVVLPQAENRFAAERRKNVLTHFCSDEHAWILPLVDQLADSAFDRVYDGLGGDVLAAGLFLSRRRLELFNAGDLAPLAQALLPGSARLRKMLPPDIERRWSHERAMDEVTRELERFRGAPNPLGQFYFWNRTRREIAVSTWSLLGRGGMVFAPFLTAEIFDFIAPLPAEYLVDQTFHSEALALRYREAADLPFEDKNAPLVLASRRSNVNFVAAAVRHFGLRKRRLAFVRERFLVPRLARMAASRTYGTLAQDEMRLPIYLQQLQEAVEARQ